MRYLLFIFFPFLACKNNSSNEKAFSYDVPSEIGSMNQKYFLESEKNFYDLLGLKSLEKGTDSFEIRISILPGIIVGLDIFSIKKDSTGWSGKHIYFQDKKVVHDYLGETRYQLFNSEVDSFWMGKPFTPICGWAKFIDSLNYYKLNTIRDQSLIEGCNFGGLDGETAVIELATKTSYKYISHWISGNSKCDEFVRFKSFIQMMQRQLGIDYCWPNCWLKEN